MNFTQSFRLAIKSLLTSKMRALLTMLGIIIGVGAVIVITSLGNGMQQMMNQQFEQLGANLLQVQIYNYGGASSRMVDPADMYALVDKYPQYLSGVSPYVRTQAMVRQGSEEFGRTTIYGVSEFFYDADRNQTMSGETLAQGRFLSYVDVDRYQNVCVIGSYLAQNAFGGDALGRTLTIRGTPFTVIGVLTQKSDGTEGSGDDILFLPYGNAMRLNGTGWVDLYLFNSTSKAGSTAAKGIIENRLFQTYQDDDAYFVMSSAEMMDAMNTMMSTMMLVLVAIAAISLLVGGIGIMNIMLVSVAERTREIGIRKALGAREGIILRQFVIEAATTSALGGGLGIILGYLMSAVATQVIKRLMETAITVSPSATAVLAAFGISAGIGILFGYLPAKRAARLDPIEALRYD